MSILNICPKLNRLAAVGVVFASVGTCAYAQTSALTAQPTGAVTNHLPYYPVQIKLTDTKPNQIVKEPTYRAKPKYGILHVGNGPKSEFAFALDEPENADAKIYIDKNQNGDLTDDGNGAWNNKRTKGRVMYGVMDVALRASYGTATKETGSSPYVLGLYRFPDLPALITYRETARAGRLVIDGKGHNVLLAENDADGVFNKPAEGKDAQRPVWLMVDLKNDGKMERVDARSPFKLDGKAYEAKISADGFNLTVSPTTRVVADAPKPPESAPLLKAGTPAPKFVAQKWGGGNLTLADYAGKVVILDFWATWCGPCQKSMPHIQKVSKMLNGQDVVVVGLCVWDEADAYKEWMPKNQDKYTFQFAFDPAGRAPTNIAQKLFNVSAIPTTYIIDKNGNVADAIVGYDDNDTRLEESLKKLGITLTGVTK